MVLGRGYNVSPPRKQKICTFIDDVSQSKIAWNHMDQEEGTGLQFWARDCCPVQRACTVVLRMRFLCCTRPRIVALGWAWDGSSVLTVGFLCFAGYESNGGLSGHQNDFPMWHGTSDLFVLGLNAFVSRFLMPVFRAQCALRSFGMPKQLCLPHFELGWLHSGGKCQKKKALQPSHFGTRCKMGQKTVFPKCIQHHSK